MTSTFEEAHPRAEKQGLFVGKEFGAPEISLGFFEDVTSNDRSVTEYADGAELTTLRPNSIGDVRDAFSGDDQADDGKVRLVRISEPMAVLVDEDVYGPTDGRPLLIDIVAGAGSVCVHSGHVVIRIDSPFPNDVEVLGEAEVTVIVARGRSAVVTAQEKSNVLVIAEEGARGALRVESRDAIADVVGATARFHLVHTCDWRV
jgi:hypothetical protein